MVSWFFENFEDPSQETPYNGREGGFLYIHGGPFEAGDYIPDAFPEATEEEHAEAIDRIDGEGPEFAPAGHRILHPEEDDGDRYPYPSPPLSYRLDALGEQLQEIKTHVTEILALQQRERSQMSGLPQMGHNHPPDDDIPDFHEVYESIGEVERELAKPDRQDVADVDVIVRAEGRFSRFLSWIKGLAKDAPTLMAKGAITAAGATAFNYVVKHQAELSKVVGEAAGTLGNWAAALTHMF